MTTVMFEMRCSYCLERVGLTRTVNVHRCQKLPDGQLRDAFAHGKATNVIYHPFPTDPPSDPTTAFGKVDRFIGAVRAGKAAFKLASSQKKLISEEKRKAAVEEYAAAEKECGGAWKVGRFLSALEMIDAAFILNDHALPPYMGTIGQLRADDPVAREYFAAKDELIKALEAECQT